jgi:hypothetical protein
MMPLRSSCCCDRSASVPGAVRGMTFIAESQAAINPFSFSCASGLSKSSCSAACSLALIASSASLRQRKTVCEACSSVIRIAWLVGPGGTRESARYTVSALSDPGPCARLCLRYPAVMEGHDAILFYRRWRSGNDLPACSAQAMMWTLRQKFAVAAEAIASFHLLSSAGRFDVTFGRVCHSVLPR